MSYQDQPCNIMSCLPTGASLESTPTEEITDLTGTTWYFNETISVADLHDESTAEETYVNYYYISFYNNNMNTYSILKCNPPTSQGTYIINHNYNLYYRYDLVYSGDDNSWSRSSSSIDDRTITIIGGNDVTNSLLISWLQANATYIVINRTSDIIEFTISGTTYQAEEGMNWVEWCDSTYNTGSYYTSGLSSTVGTGGGAGGKSLYYDNGRRSICGGMYIENNHAYYAVSAGAGN